MIYTHHWEADTSLKELRQLSNLVNHEAYDWHNEIPERDKYEFITKTIRDVLIAADLDAGKLIKESYNSQLRNAFAHGQYAFRGKNTIALLNHKGQSYEMESISYADWEQRFLKTALLFYELVNQKIDLLEKYGREHPEIPVWLPKGKSNVLQCKELIWSEPGRRYIYKQPV
jgi:hypothetical protein